MQDPYCYPDSRVLKNKLNITDFDELYDEERNLSILRKGICFAEFSRLKRKRNGFLRNYAKKNISKI